MYGITVKQKKALKVAVKNYVGLQGLYPDAQDLPEFDIIGDMNPCEVYWQYATRYVEDLKRDDEFVDVLKKMNGGW